MPTVDYNLHEKAGLTCTGINKFGEEEWEGTSKQWHKYYLLRQHHDNQTTS